MFEKGKKYSRLEIQQKLGGSLDEFLPHENGRIVCGCFKLFSSPAAPRVILLDNKPELLEWARLLRKQSGSIPVFVKDRGNEWECKGHYRVKACYDDYGHL